MRIKQVTHTKPFDFNGVHTFGVLGRSLDDVLTPIPFESKRVSVREVEESEVKLGDQGHGVPDVIHVFRARGDDEEVVFWVKDRVVIRMFHRRRSRESLSLSRLLRGLVHKILRPGPPRTSENKPLVKCSGEASSIVALDGDGLFRWANDTDECLVCDWRESPDAVVEGVNPFLPESLRFRYTETAAGFALVNANGRCEMSDDDYEHADEPVPMLVREINALIAPTHEARSLNCLEGSDGYAYFVQSAGFWRDLDTGLPQDSIRIFSRP